MPLYPNSSLSQPAAPVAVTLRGPELPSISDIREIDSVPTQANGQYVRFDKNDDVFYYIETNEHNYKNVKRYRFYEDPIPKPEDNFATKQEMQELRGGLADVQLAIQELTNTIRSANNTKPAKQHNGPGKPNVQNGNEQFKPSGNVPENGYEQPTGKSSLQSNPS